MCQCRFLHKPFSASTSNLACMNPKLDDCSVFDERELLISVSKARLPNFVIPFPLGLGASWASVHSRAETTDKAVLGDFMDYLLTSVPSSLLLLLFACAFILAIVVVFLVCRPQLTAVLLVSTALRCKSTGPSSATQWRCWGFSKMTINSQPTITDRTIN